MKRVLFIDPGEKVGWARADVAENGDWTDLRHGITSWKEFVTAVYGRQLKTFDVFAPPPYDVIGYEVFRLYATHAKALIGSDMQTSQCIGAVRLIAWLSGTKLVSQGANVKKSAEASAPPWLTKHLSKLPKRHDEAHDYDALLHLWHWTFKHHDVDPASHQGGTRA